MKFTFTFTLFLSPNFYCRQYKINSTYHMKLFTKVSETNSNSRVVKNVSMTQSWHKINILICLRKYTIVLTDFKKKKDINSTLHFFCICPQKCKLKFFIILLKNSTKKFSNHIYSKKSFFMATAFTINFTIGDVVFLFVMASLFCWVKYFNSLTNMKFCHFLSVNADSGRGFIFRKDHFSF